MLKMYMLTVMTVNEAIKGPTVSALIVTNERRWDIDLIHDIFDQRDVDLILATPPTNNDLRGGTREKKRLAIIR